MRKIKKMMAILMLAAVTTLGAQTAFADSAPGVLFGDRQVSESVKPMDLVDSLMVFIQSGIIVAGKDSIIVAGRDGIIIVD